MIIIHFLSCFLYLSVTFQCLFDSSYDVLLFNPIPSLPESLPLSVTPLRRPLLWQQNELPVPVRSLCARLQPCGGGLWSGHPEKERSLHNWCTDIHQIRWILYPPPQPSSRQQTAESNFNKANRHIAQHTHTNVVNTDDLTFIFSCRSLQ